MCGIAGFVGARPPSDKAVADCLARMGRRGPDATGVYRHSAAADRHVCLLHSRLSIIDLDARSNQPFTDGPLTLVLNGEIYNYVELRARLANGLPWRTSSDTEVLLRLLAQEGVGGLDRAEGMWAFACYDARDGSLLLSRDRFGEKPLYLMADEDGLYFGSEIKFIAALAGRRLTPNVRQVLRLVVNGYRSLYKTGETFFREIDELSAGETLLDRGQGDRETARYWQPRVAIDEAMSFDRAVAEVRERLSRAVEIRLRADLPLAFCQSGGIDSNSLISIAKNGFGYDVHGFTIVNTDERYVEQDMVDLAVEEQGLRHTAIRLNTAGFLEGLRNLVRYHDAPVFTVSAYTHWLLMEAISGRGYKIAISGTGADELFSGYYDHHLFYLAVLHGRPQHREALANWQRHIGPLTQNPLLRDPDRFVHAPGERSHLYGDAAVASGALAAPFREAFDEEDYGCDLLRNRMLNELFVETIPPPLHEEDLNAMYWSVENRSPFLDRGLFEFCNTIPTRHLIRDGSAKAVLREAMRGIVPDAILDNRRKMGFNAPLADLLDLSSNSAREALLDDSPIFDLVDRDAIERVMSRPSLDHATNLFLFATLSSKMFLEECDR
jgi:asparagine synthase (glutamine-hydrolysing)